jgi:energy-coupling factor transporter ATP-binding protein EcfA2
VFQWYLSAIEINGGFLPGFSLQFPRGLTCIIGPRGSGKSTLIEALRFGVGGIRGASKPRLELIDANLGPHSLVTIKTANSGDDGGYTIRRNYKHPASLIASDGSSLTTVDLDRGTFLPLDGYSSAEIEGIADESVGDKRRALLDELKTEELSQIHLSVANHRRNLEANSDRIRATQRLTQDLAEQIADIGDVRAKLRAMAPSPDNSVSKEMSNAAKQCQLNIQESRSLNATLESLDEFRTELQLISQKLGKESLVQFASDESINVRLLRMLEDEIAEVISVATSKLLSTIDEVNKIETIIRETQRKIAASHTEQVASYAQLKERNAVAGKSIQERSSAEHAVAQLEELEAQLSLAKNELHSLHEERKSLKGKYLLEIERISTLRELVAKELQREAGENVRIRIRRNADNLNYRQILTEALRGARVRNQDEIVKRLMRLRPEQLAQLIMENRADEFEMQMSLGDDRSRKVLASLSEHIDPLTLETVAIDDRIYIELNLATRDQPNFKDASDLSRGQKCTALLPILLARRDSPLVIDQPEDNLDNHFIYETVVETIRRMKSRRQMVFVTHNANIPVLAEADLVVVLNSDGRTGYIEKFGTLEECREEIIDLLEGGRQAFDLRRQRYEQN